MSFQNFINRICYDTSCPDYVNKHRWRGMLKWFNKRSENDDWVVQELFFRIKDLNNEMKIKPIHESLIVQ